MTNEKSNAPLKPRTETTHTGVRPGEDQTIKIINDIQKDALIFFHNGAWGPISVGYVRVGKSVDLTTNVNVDAFALFEADEGVFLYWPNFWTVNKTYNTSKGNLTPGQSYHLSDFGAVAGAVAG